MGWFRAILVAVLLAMLQTGCQSTASRFRSQQESEAAEALKNNQVHPALSPNPFVRAKYEASWRSEHFALAMSDFFGGFSLGGRDDDEDEYDPYAPEELWKQGYGYENPNKERIKQGKEPLDLGEVE